MIEEIKGAVGEAIKPLAEKVDGFDARLKKIEETPLMQKAVNIITTPKEYLGRKISKMGALYRGKGVFADEAKADEFTKALIHMAVRKTALSEGGDANGGYLVPDEYAMEMIALAKNSSFALQACRVINMGSDTLKLPTELTRGSATWVAESTQKTASEPTFGQVTLTAKKLMNLAVTSNELIQDADFDIASMLAEQFAYTMAQELDNQLFNGTGDPISGVLTAKAGYSVVLSGASMSAVTAPDLSLAISKLEEGRLAGARWFFGRLATHYIRSLKDSQQRPIFAEIGGVTPRTVYEFPTNVTENIANTDGGSKALGVFGNFNYFLIGRRLGAMVIEADPYSRFDYYDTRFRMVTRWGMGYGDANAFVRVLSGA